MRLFAGVELDDRARQAAAAAIAALRGRLHGRWVAPRNLHITIRFVGEVPDDRAPAIVEALAQPIARAPFAVALDGGGAFPPSGAVRAAWIGLTAAPYLSGLHAICSERLQPFGYEPEGRPFAAHVTIARCTDARSAESRAIRAALADLRVEPARWAVERMTIFRSHLSSRGPRYEPLAYATLVVPLT